MGKKLQIQIYIDRFHKWRPINYSLVNVLIRPTSLVLKEHFFCILSVLSRLVGLVGLISTKTIECYFWPPFMQSVHGNTIGSRPSALKRVKSEFPSSGIVIGS